MVVSFEPGAYDHLLESFDIAMSLAVHENEYIVTDNSVVMLDGSPRKTIWFSPIDYLWVTGSIKKKTFTEIDADVQQWINQNIQDHAEAALRRLDALVDRLNRDAMLLDNKRKIDYELHLYSEHLDLDLKEIGKTHD